MNPQSLEQYLNEHTDDPRRIDEILLTAPNFTEEMVLRLIAETLGLEFVDEINAASVPEAFIEAIPAPYAQHHYLIGLRRDGDADEVVVAVANPLNSLIVDNVSRKLHKPVRMVVSSRAAITAAIDIAYEQKNTVIEEVAE